MKKRGVTLIELVAVIVVISLAIPVLLRLFADVANRSMRSEATSAAAFYAEQMLEEIRVREFDENSLAPWSTTLGPESGETYPSSYDDIDDFNGRTDTPAAGYSRTVTVNYVTLSGTTWVSSASSTNYKRIRVNVSRTDNIVTNVDLEMIMVGGG